MDQFKNMSSEEIRDLARDREVITNIRAILGTSAGRGFVKYLFRYFEVNELPPVGLYGDLLIDKLGYLRAGNAIFKIVARADADIASAILGQLEKESNEELP